MTSVECRVRLDRSPLAFVTSSPCYVVHSTDNLGKSAFVGNNEA